MSDMNSKVPVVGLEYEGEDVGTLIFADGTRVFYDDRYAVVRVPGQPDARVDTFDESAADHLLLQEPPARNFVKMSAAEAREHRLAMEGK